jgi:hypothetical protein
MRLAANGTQCQIRSTGAALKACEEDGILAYVPQAGRAGRLAAKGCFSHTDFAHDAEANVYLCPAGEPLRPTKRLKQNAGGRLEVRYVSRKPVCDACPLRERCITAKSGTRTICRWVHEDVLDRHRERMQAAAWVMRRRAGLAEHPFGTLKCRAGYRHFLLRGFNKVRGEWSLMALAYNFTRVLNIIGIDGFTAYLARRRPPRARALLHNDAVRRFASAALAAICRQTPPKMPITGLR